MIVSIILSKKVKVTRLDKYRFDSIIGFMENTETNEFKKLLEGFAADYIPLNFKGQTYDNAILFIEILLEKLKEGQQNSDSPIIKDYFGR
jgi:hypothetical protein